MKGPLPSHLALLSLLAFAFRGGAGMSSIEESESQWSSRPQPLQYVPSFGGTPLSLASAVSV